MLDFSENGLTITMDGINTRHFTRSQLAGGAEPTATVQLVGVGSLDTFVDGIGISHALPAGQLVPGADVVVHLSDRHHPGDAQVVAIAGVATSGGSGDVSVQSGNVPVGTDQNGNGAVGVMFAVPFRAAPSVTVGAVRSVLGPGSIQATAVTDAGFTIAITGAAMRSGTVMASWSAEGSI